MDQGLINEFRAMATAAAWVAAVAGPVALLALVAQWSSAGPVCVPRRPAFVRARAADLLALFFGLQLIPVVVKVGLDSAGVFEAVYGPPTVVPDGVAAVVGAVSRAEETRPPAVVAELKFIWAGLLAPPLVLAAWLTSRPTTGAEPLRWGTWRGVPGRLAVGVLGWPVVHACVFGVYAVTLAVLALVGGAAASHPLVNVRLETADVGTILLFGVFACGIAPFLEELLFRGLMLGWAVNRGDRALVLSGLGVVLSAVSLNPAAVGFAGLLACGTYVLGVMPRRVAGVKVRPRLSGSVWASSAAFAVAHSAVWPTPVPLFVLGLALGWLRIRTGGILAGMVLHGLFNAVSFVYLLRGSA